MKINTKSLIRIINALPAPRHAGERYNMQLQERADELNEAHPRDFSLTPSHKTVRVLTFEAVAYARGHDRWLEWELRAPSA